jgi:hypothetical protein
LFVDLRFDVTLDMNAIRSLAGFALSVGLVVGLALAGAGEPVLAKEARAALVVEGDSASTATAAPDSAEWDSILTLVSRLTSTMLEDMLSDLFYVGPRTGSLFLEPGMEAGTPLGRSVGFDVGVSTEGGFRESWVFDRWGGGAVVLHGESGRGGWKAALGFGVAAHGGEILARIATVHATGHPSHATPGDWYIGPEVVIRLRAIRVCLGGLYRVAGDDRSGRLIPSASIGVAWAWRP